MIRRGEFLEDGLRVSRTRGRIKRNEQSPVNEHNQEFVNVALHCQGDALLYVVEKVPAEVVISCYKRLMTSDNC